MKKSNHFKILMTAGTAISMIGGILSFWFSIENKIQQTIKESTTLVTEELYRKTGDIAEMIRSDLRNRIIVLEEEIKELERQGKPVPERKRMHLRLMEEQLKEANNKWLKRNND